MKLDDVRLKASAMPLTNPAYPKGPYRFYNREYLVVSYRTDPDALRAVVPEPLEIGDPIVKYEFIRMPDSTGFGDYTESGQVIPVTYKGEKGAFVHSMYLDDEAPIAGGREIWGFPKKLAAPKLSHENEVLVGTLHYGSVLCAGRDDGLQAHDPSPRAAAALARRAELPDQDHPARRRLAQGLRAGSLPHAGRRSEGRLERSGRARAVSSRHGRRRQAAGAGRHRRRSLRRRPHIGIGRGRARLSRRRAEDRASARRLDQRPPRNEHEATAIRAHRLSRSRTFRPSPANTIGSRSCYRAAERSGPTRPGSTRRWPRPIATPTGSPAYRSARSIRR